MGTTRVGQHADHFLPRFRGVPCWWDLNQGTYLPVDPVAVRLAQVLTARKRPYCLALRLCLAGLRKSLFFSRGAKNV